MRKAIMLATAAVLCLAASAATAATREPRPAPAMSCETFKHRLAEEIVKGGDRVVDPEFSPFAVDLIGTSLGRHAFSNIRGLSGDLTCGDFDDHFIKVEMASDAPQLDNETIARILRLKALAAAALGVVVEISAPAAKRAVEGVFDEARDTFASDNLRGALTPHGFAFHKYSDIPSEIDGASIDVSFERGKITVAVFGAD